MKITAEEWVDTIKVAGVDGEGIGNAKTFRALVKVVVEKIDCCSRRIVNCKVFCWF